MSNSVKPKLDKGILIIRRKHLSTRMVVFLLVLIAICLWRIIYLLIEEGKSASDGGLPGAIAMFIYLPILLFSLSKLIGPIDIYKNGKLLSSRIFVVIIIAIIIIIFGLLLILLHPFK